MKELFCIYHSQPCQVLWLATSLFVWSLAQFCIQSQKVQITCSLELAGTWGNCGRWEWHRDRSRYCNHYWRSQWSTKAGLFASWDVNGSQVNWERQNGQRGSFWVIVSTASSFTVVFYSENLWPLWQTISYAAERVVGTGSFGIVFQVSCYFLLSQVSVS